MRRNAKGSTTVTRLFDKSDLSNPGLHEWFRDAYRQFHDLVVMDQFPCYFGTAAEVHGDLKYTYVAGHDLTPLPDTLLEFIALSRAHPNAKHNLTVFFEPEKEEKSFSYYKDFMWGVMDYLHRNDPSPWPAAVPVDPNHLAWEFCFGGDAFFLFASSPAYRRRRSRNYGPAFVMLFQPKRIFASLDIDSAAGVKARTIIRDRLKLWDGIDTLPPDIGDYGSPMSYRWKQYMFEDEDVPMQGTCPFKHQHSSREILAMTSGSATDHLGAARIVRGKRAITPVEGIDDLIPKIGTIKVRRDPPGHVHATHTHDTDEVLLILEGSLTFAVGDRTASCYSGDRLILPVNTQHSSVAGSEGCLYLIHLAS